MPSKYIPKSKSDKSMGPYLRKLVKENADSALEVTFFRQIVGVGLPLPLQQYKWHPERKFKADFAYDFPPFKLLIEVDGGTWQQMGHSTGSGIERDHIKDAEALILGFKTLRLTGTMVKDGSGIKYLEQIFKGVQNG